VYIHECVCKQNLLKGGRKVMGQAETVRDVCARLSVSAPAYAWVRVLREHASAHSRHHIYMMARIHKTPHIHNSTCT